MPTPLADLVVLGAIAFLAFQGMSNGLFLAAYQTIQFIAPLTLAFSFYEKLAQLLQMAGCPEDWAVFASFAALFGGGVLTLRQAGDRWLPEDGAPTYKLLDKIGGLAVGGLGGAVLAGAILILWSMCPLAAPLRIDANKLRVDMGRQMIYRFAALTRVAGAPDYPFVVRGETAAKPGDPDAQPLKEEPYVDVNRNGMRDAGEPFVDLNADGKFSKNIFFHDKNKNKKWDPGVLDRYIIGYWTAEGVLGANPLDVASATDTDDEEEESDGTGDDVQE